MARKKKSSPRRESSSGTLSRRHFLGGTAMAGAALGAGAEAKAAAGKPKALGPQKASISLDINGKKRAVSVETRSTLLRAMRNQLDLTGSKEVCNGGACGACSVIVDGALVNACMMFAVDAVGRKITTVEGLSNGDKIHPIQKAFVEKDALQCGFCTPGMVMACKALLDKTPNPDLHQIKKGLRGNLCRCGTYTRIFEAVKSVAKSVTKEA